MRTREDWESYNEDMGSGYNARLMTSPTGLRSISVKSYTHNFLQDHHASELLNDECHRMLQLGAADGRYIAEKKEQGWQVKAYEYTETGRELLKQKHIDTNGADLNSIDQATHQLSYSKQLIDDVYEPTNILLIRILQYLELPALNLLLHTLIEHAGVGSVIIIAGGKTASVPESENYHSTTPNYKASFFAARTDFEFLRGCTVNANDELLVVRKLGSANNVALKELQDAIQKSSLTSEIQSHFSELAIQDLTKAELCFNVAKKLLTIANDQFKKSQRWFASYRGAVKVQALLKTQLHKVIDELSHGQFNHAKHLINEIIYQLRVIQGELLLTSVLPEVIKLKEIYHQMIHIKIEDVNRVSEIKATC